MNGNDLGEGDGGRPLFYVEACYVCGALINGQSPWRVSVHWGERRFKGDEVCVTPVATEVGFCHGCYAELLVDERVVVKRQGMEIVVERIEGQTARGVCNDRTLAAYGLRRERTE